MDRIAGKNVSGEASQKWADLVPKIFRIAEIENNTNVNTLGVLQAEYSDGKCAVYITCVCVDQRR